MEITTRTDHTFEPLCLFWQGYSNKSKAFQSDSQGYQGCGGGWREGEEEVREQQHRLHAVIQGNT